jgi:putative phosphoesterase
MKIGVIGDTHIPALSPVLPARIAHVFKGLDIILHVGDVCELYVLEELQETYTLTFAVWGERDSEEARLYLEEKRTVRFGQRQVGMIHGHQFAAKKGPWERLRHILGRRPSPVALPEFLLAQFAGEDVQAVLFGHTHEPFVATHQGIRIFNPGSALPGPGRRPSVGILDMGTNSITGQIVYL